MHSLNRLQRHKTWSFGSSPIRNALLIFRKFLFLFLWLLFQCIYHFKMISPDWNDGHKASNESGPSLLYLIYTADLAEQINILPTAVKTTCVVGGIQTGILPCNISLLGSQVISSSIGECMALTLLDQCFSSRWGPPDTAFKCGLWRHSEWKPPQLNVIFIAYNGTCYVNTPFLWEFLKKNKRVKSAISVWFIVILSSPPAPWFIYYRHLRYEAARRRRAAGCIVDRL